MSSLQEIGATVKARRSDMGLTQSKLAHLSGLSRSTVNQLENGSVGDLSFNRASRLLSVIGLRVDVPSARARSRAHHTATSKALELAAKTASVSYRSTLTPTALRRALLSNQIPDDYAPHLFVLVDEVPVALLADVVDELHREHGIARADIWARMKEIAVSLKSSREIWR